MKFQNRQMMRPCGAERGLQGAGCALRAAEYDTAQQCSAIARAVRISTCCTAPASTNAPPACSCANDIHAIVFGPKRTRYAQ